MRKEIVAYAEEQGMNASLIKYKINGRQFRHYYKKYGTRMEKGKRIVTKKDIKEMAKLSDEKGPDVVVDKYCICRDQLYAYFKRFGYNYVNRKWKKVYDSNENNTKEIEPEKRIEPENTDYYLDKDMYSGDLATLMKRRGEQLLRSQYSPNEEENLESKYNGYNSNSQNGNKKSSMIEKMKEIVSFADRHGDKKAMEKYEIN